MYVHYRMLVRMIPTVGCATMEEMSCAVIGAPESSMYSVQVWCVCVCVCGCC